MDAISFVLGIRSSQLRSEKLRDLVYRGRVLKTSKINDDGSADAPAANGQVNGNAEGEDDSQSQRNDPKSAWVMAVYEDEAGEVQKWKRTITNQGGSEYRINDRVVTAQQYNEILEGENILVKARNFLVFQGDVEAIASQSPKDLTRLIEQISGSLEYKPEYERLEEEAEQAAEDQMEKLQARRGINSEIKQLQDQKRSAEKYQNKADERDNAIVQHTLWKLFHFQKVMEESAAEIRGHQEEMKEFRRGIAKYETALKEAGKEQARVQKEVHKVEQSIKNKEKEIDEKENSLVPIDEKVDQTVAKIDKIKKSASNVTRERDQESAEIQSARKELAVVEKAERQFEAQWKETMQKQGKDLSAADLKEYNKLKAEVIIRTTANQGKLDNLLRQQKSDEVVVNSLKSNVDAAQSKVEKLEEEVSSIEERIHTKEASMKEITTEIEGKKKDLTSIRSERVRTNQKYTELNDKLQAVLKSLEEADDGRRQSDKEKRTLEMVKNLKRHYPGVKGRVGDLCRPKQKKFHEAVATAMGRDFDSIIVDTEKTGADCVQYLKDQRFAPMTFIPLDNIKVNPSDSSLKNLPKARLTLDTIDFDSSLERAMSYACGNSLVCDDLATARHICFDKRIEVKAVTLEGIVIHKAGLMTGGRGADAKGRKRRFEDHDVQNLNNMKSNFLAQIDSLPKGDRKGLAAEEILQSDITGLGQHLEYIKSELLAFHQNLDSKKKNLDHEKKELKKIKPRYNQQAQELEAIKAQVKEFQDVVSKVEDEVFAAFCQKLGYADIRAYEAQQGSQEQEAAQRRSDFSLQKQKLESRLSLDQVRLKSTEGRLERMEKQIDGLERDIKTYKAEKAALEEALDIDNAELQTLTEQLEAQKARYAQKTDKVAQASNELQQRKKKMDGTNKAIIEKQTELENSSGDRFTLLRRCKLEQIKIPLEEDSASLESLPIDNIDQEDSDVMDVDEGDMPEATVKDYGIKVDFDELDDDLKDEVSQYVVNYKLPLTIFSPTQKKPRSNCNRESQPSPKN
jgi:structural maintenance of chromosome 1